MEDVLSKYKHVISSGEENTGELITVPDQSYTIEELIDKFSRGIAPNIVRHQPTYDDDGNDELPFVPDDIVDVQQRYDMLMQRAEHEKRDASSQAAVNKQSDTDVKDVERSSETAANM